MAKGSGRKHSKNAGNMGSENLTYAERKAMGLGTIKERLGKETVKDFNHCALSLQHACENPCVTPEGVLYEREHVLRHLLKQKEGIERRKRDAAKEKEKIELDAMALKEKERQLEVKKFHAQNHGAGEYQETNDIEQGNEAEIAKRNEFGSTFDKRRAESLNEFWTNAVRTKENVVDGARSGSGGDKKNLCTKCPQTGKKLRAKDLTKVKWTKATDDESVLICPVTMKTFTNSTPIVILKPTGDAISREAYELVIKKEGTYEGKKIDPKKDIIHLQRGGTGFAASGTQVESKIETIIGQGSGRADIRGQNASAPSRFGLRM